MVSLLHGKLKNKQKKGVNSASFRGSEDILEYLIHRTEKENMHKGLQETDILGILERKKELQFANKR